MFSKEKIAILKQEFEGIFSNIVAYLIGFSLSYLIKIGGNGHTISILMSGTQAQ